jgi:hypothetical protein
MVPCARQASRRPYRALAHAVCSTPRAPRFWRKLTKILPGHSRPKWGQYFSFYWVELSKNSSKVLFQKKLVRGNLGPQLRAIPLRREPGTRGLLGPKRVQSAGSRAARSGPGCASSSLHLRAGFVSLPQWHWALIMAIPQLTFHTTLAIAHWPPSCQPISKHTFRVQDDPRPGADLVVPVYSMAQRCGIPFPVLPHKRPAVQVEIKAIARLCGSETDSIKTWWHAYVGDIETPKK